MERTQFIHFEGFVSLACQILFVFSQLEKTLWHKIIDTIADGQRIDMEIDNWFESRVNWELHYTTVLGTAGNIVGSDTAAVLSAKRKHPIGFFVFINVRNFKRNRWKSFVVGFRYHIGIVSQKPVELQPSVNCLIPWFASLAMHLFSISKMLFVLNH